MLTHRYLPAMDGLRAIAVLAVILFHLDPSLLCGGFIGVDVFFVISGYLITQALNLPQKPDLLQFYERRIRRLFPSLVTMLLCCTLFGALILSGGDLMAFADSLGASLFFTGNIFFYYTRDYFDTSQTTAPLLHLWSLGVEMQFYLLWPFVMAAAMRWNIRPLSLVAGLAAVSIAGAGLVGHADASMAFYWLPWRVFEFAIGAVLCWLPPFPPTRRYLQAALAAAALGTLLSLYIFFDQHTPVYAMILPCMAAAALIYTGRSGFSRWVLANAPITYIGRISYELYLFHWPALIYYRYLGLDTSSLTAQLGLLGTIFLLAAACYHLIGRPLRHVCVASVTQRQNYLLACACLGTVLLLATLSIRLSAGWPWRIPQTQQLYASGINAFHKTRFGGNGYPENTPVLLGTQGAKPDFLLFGDSFAGQYAQGLDQFLKENNRSAYLFYVNSCLIMPHMVARLNAQPNRACEEAFGNVQRLVVAGHLPVIQSQSWNSYKSTLVTRQGETLHFPEADNNAYYRVMFDGIRQMQAALGAKHYVFVGIAPGIQGREHLMRCMDTPNLLPNRCGESSATAEETQQNGQEFNLAAKQLSDTSPALLFLNPRTAMCRDGLCYALEDNVIYYSDYIHLTRDGALRVLNHYRTMLLSLHHD